MTRRAHRWSPAPAIVGLHRTVRFGPKKAVVVIAFLSAGALALFLTASAVWAAASGLLTAGLVTLALIVANPRCGPQLLVGILDRLRRISSIRTRRTGPVIAGMASIPERSDMLREAVSSVLDQVDHLHVYLNRYESVPSYLESPKISVHRSQDYGDIADNGKFFGLQGYSKGIFFSLDDDIVYPGDYVQRMIDALRAINFAGIVGVHGVYYPTAPRSFLDRKLVHYVRANAGLRPVSQLGTGTVAFPIQLVGLSLEIFRTPRMADVWLAKHAKEKQIPMFAVSRPKQWLTDSGFGQAPESIWISTKANHAPATALIVADRPWGLEDLLQRIENGPLSPKVPTEWLDFVRFYRLFKSSGPENALANAAVYGRIPEYIAFYCEPSDVLAIAKAVLANKGWNTPVFRRTAAVALSYDPLDAARLYERAAKQALRQGRRSETVDLASRAARAYRLGGEFEHANIILDMASPQGGSSTELLAEAINLHIDRRQYREARNLILERSFVLATEADYDHKMALVVAHCDSVEAASPWIIKLFLDPSNRRGQGKLISHLRNLHSPVERLARTAAYQLLEEAVVDRGLDPLPTIHLHLALGDRQSAAELLARTRPRVVGERPDYMAILDAALADDVETMVGHLNTMLGEAGFAELTLVPGPGGTSVLRRLRGGTPAVKVPDLVSVIMTAYNCVDTIGYAIDSILNQSIRNLQLIVVDDCSTDGTSKVAEEYASRDSRVRVVRSESNSGPYVCRNIGVEHADGTYIAIQDSDDYAHPQRLEYQLQLLQQEDWVACYVGHLRITDDGAIIPDNHGELVGEGPMTLMMCRQVVDELGYFIPVRSRGDIEHRDRMNAFYGSHRVGMDDSVLLLARDSLKSNSRVFDADPARLGVVPMIKAEARKRHLLAAGRRDLLYVDGSSASVDVGAWSLGSNGSGRRSSNAAKQILGGTTPARSLKGDGAALSGVPITVVAEDGQRTDPSVGGVPSPLPEKDDLAFVASEGGEAPPDRFGPIVKLPRKIKGKYRRPLKREYLESGKLLDRLKTIRHPNLMSVYDYDKEYVYVEYIDGLVLSNRSPYCPPQHTDCYIDHVYSVDLTPIKNAIEHLHRNGVAHSDVTSHNIMVTSDGTLKLIDLICCLPPRRDFVRRDLMMFEDLEQEIRAELARGGGGELAARDGRHEP